MTNHVFRRDLVARNDVLDQRYQHVDLRLREGCEHAALRRVLPAGIHDLDADRAAVQLGVALPARDAGVVGGAGFVDQAVDGRLRVVGDEVVGADLLLGQDLDRGRLVGHGVVQHQETHAAGLAGSAQALVDARTGRGTTGQQGNHEGSKDFFHW